MELDAYRAQVEKQKQQRIKQMEEEKKVFILNPTTPENTRSLGFEYHYFFL